MSMGRWMLKQAYTGALMGRGSALFSFSRASRFG